MKTLDTKRETLQNKQRELKRLIAQKERRERAFTQLKEYQRINKELQHRRILSAEERLKLTSIVKNIKYYRNKFIVYKKRLLLPKMIC